MSHAVVSFHSSYAFLENILVYTMLNPLGKKRVRVYIMPNLLLRETNSLRSDVNPVKNNETQQRKGTQDRSMDKFEGMTSTRCL
jgi:hypothetical protein